MMIHTLLIVIKEPSGVLSNAAVVGLMSAPDTARLRNGEMTRSKHGTSAPITVVPGRRLMPRREFDKPTKREALKRSGGLCEAVGEWYGLKEDKRCNAPLSYGVEFDHIDLDANSKDNSLSNCAAVCPACHRIKTRTHDIPVAAKTVRQQDKHRGIRKKSHGFQKPPGTKYNWSTGRYEFP